MSSAVDSSAVGRSTMTATEATVAEIWRELLGVQRVVPTDSFFDVGGTSLSAIKLLQRVETRFGADVLSPEQVFGDPRLGSMARAIDEAVRAR
jgi:acyl carrier protein